VLTGNSSNPVANITFDQSIEYAPREDGLLLSGKIDDQNYEKFWVDGEKGKIDIDGKYIPQ
jgi:hypothetical protein